MHISPAVTLYAMLYNIVEIFGERSDMYVLENVVIYICVQ